jgi:hypothetical protein
MDREFLGRHHPNDTDFLADYFAWCIYKAKRKRREEQQEEEYNSYA